MFNKKVKLYKFFYFNFMNFKIMIYFFYIFKQLMGHSYNAFTRRPEIEEKKGVFRSINK